MKVRTKNEILEQIEQNKTAVAAYGLKRLGLFGSFAREQQESDSDVDVLVEFEPGQKTFQNFMSLCFLLEELFKRDVEIVTPESLSPSLKPNILQEAEYITLNSNFQISHSEIRIPKSEIKKE
jgi:hypothetical protein